MTPARGPLLGAGKVAEVFAYGDHVLKLYRSGIPKTAAFREAAILSLLEQLGLPAPRVIEARAFEDRWGVVMTRAEGPTFAEALTATPPDPAHLDALISLQLRINAQPGAQLPMLRGRLAANIARAPLLEDAQREQLLDALAELPDGDRLCHGDFHPWNVLGTPGNVTIVDWPDASCGSPAADACRSFVLMAPHVPALADAYVERYAAAAGFELADIWRWRPVVAAARLAEGVPETQFLLGLIDG